MRKISRRPYGLRKECSYTPKDTDDVLWVWLVRFFVENNRAMVEYEPALHLAELETMPAKDFRAKYRRMFEGPVRYGRD